MRRYTQVRTTTTTTTTTTNHTLRSHFGSSHPRRGWLEFRSHGGSSPSAQLFIHCLHSLLSSQHVGHSLAFRPGPLLFVFVRSFAVSGPYLERVGAYSWHQVVVDFDVLSVFAMRSLGRSGRAWGFAALVSALVFTFVAFVYDAVVANVLGLAGCVLPSASATVQEFCADVAGYGARAEIVGLARGQKCSQRHSVFREIRLVSQVVGIFASGAVAAGWHHGRVLV